MTDKRKGEFTGTGATDPVVKTELPISVSLEEGAGTVEIQWLKSGDWRTVKALTIGTPDAVINASNGDKFRLECTAYTSGPIKYELG